ncbi:MAG: HepT-like ribonuclease domain-containing protein [Prolixibacteraceae bacterium]|nr:DUF86 domain-containing protein [Prolixibacteraceae bacterium]NLT00178.1 DUF86 domain-containing protein [Bacteroidales bacterium]
MRNYSGAGFDKLRVIDKPPAVQISEAPRIVNLRNWIVHGYDRVDDIIIWGIISRDISRSKEQSKQILQG